MTYAFPMDELNPLDCEGRKFDRSKVGLVTLIESLSTMAVMGEKDMFTTSVKIVSRDANYDIDVNVNVFETTIRILGGLLSAHLFAIDKKLDLWTSNSNYNTHTEEDSSMYMNTYNNELLNLARDLADRLLPAFETPTSIPYGTVNLKHGVPKGETQEACTAGAGSLIIEFGVLSSLLGDMKYYNTARCS